MLLLIRTFAAALCLSGVSGACPSSDRPVAKSPGGTARYEQSQIHMGTRFVVTFYAADRASATRAAAAAFDRIAELDAMLSDYSDTSELTELSRSAGGPAKRVSRELFAILSRSVELSRATGGAFDVTIGPAVRQWRRARRRHRKPTDQQIAGALEKVGFEKVQFDPRRRTVRLPTPGMLLDLGGIAKGYACDAALDVLRERGIERAMVDGGGDISVGRPPPGAKGWKIAVHHVKGDANADSGDQDGEVNGKQPGRQTLLLSGRAVATSGDLEQYVEFDGVRYSHIVDPKTGMGLTDRTRVTVVSPDGATADALASAVSVLGPEKGIAIVERFPETACFITRIADGRAETFRSRRWDGYLAARP